MWWCLFVLFYLLISLACVRVCRNECIEQDIGYDDQAFICGCVFLFWPVVLIGLLVVGLMYGIGYILLEKF